ncbi:hypothetical protein GF357_04590 [Candidatus Dojkabacteria bacterium]|nr:hypothetical protein [Candidatus Dojkabacteria bacterium]
MYSQRLIFLNQTIKRALREVRRSESYYEPLGVLIFGSYARSLFTRRSLIHPDSDVDLYTLHTKDCNNMDLPHKIAAIIGGEFYRLLGRQYIPTSAQNSFGLDRLEHTGDEAGMMRDGVLLSAPFATEEQILLFEGALDSYGVIHANITDLGTNLQA